MTQSASSKAKNDFFSKKAPWKPEWSNPGSSWRRLGDEQRRINQERREQHLGLLGIAKQVQGVQTAKPSEDVRRDEIRGKANAKYGTDDAASVAKKPSIGVHAASGQQQTATWQQTQGQILAAAGKRSGANEIAATAPSAPMQELAFRDAHTRPVLSRADATTSAQTAADHSSGTIAKYAIAVSLGSYVATAAPFSALEPTHNTDGAVGEPHCRKAPTAQMTPDTPHQKSALGTASSARNVLEKANARANPSATTQGRKRPLLGESTSDEPRPTAKPLARPRTAAAATKTKRTPTSAPKRKRATQTEDNGQTPQPAKRSRKTAAPVVQSAPPSKNLSAGESVWSAVIAIRGTGNMPMAGRMRIHWGAAE